MYMVSNNTQMQFFKLQISLPCGTLNGLELDFQCEFLCFTKYCGGCLLVYVFLIYFFISLLKALLERI